MMYIGQPFLVPTLLSVCLGQLVQKPLHHEQDNAASLPEASQTSSDGISIVTKDLEEFIEAKMKKWHVPGLSIAIIDGNKTWFKGFGYADIDSSTHMTPDTLLYCGSTTKSFTAAALSLLVDSSNYSIQWDTPISSLLREDFVLSDAWATKHITLTDALSHRTGYPRHDLSMDVPSTVDLVRNFRNLPMAAEPRTKFLYNNMMYGAMGHLITVLTGLPIVNLLRERLWKPWGMNSTFFGLDDLRAGGRYDDFAAEYIYNNDSDSFVALPHAELMADAAAGAIISNVKDYAKYLRAMMAEAGPVSKENHAMLKKPHNLILAGSEPFTGPVWYGFGWESGILQDEQVFYHGGAVNGFYSNMLMIPSRGFGLVTMLNSMSLAQEIIVWRVLYDYFDVPEEKRFDFEARGARRGEQFANFVATCPTVLYPKTPEPPIPPPLPLANFTGLYESVGYGRFNLTLECKPPSFPADSPASPTTDEGGCMLVIQPNSDEDRVGLTMHVLLQHVTGDYWVGWVFLDQLSRAGYERPMLCLRVQFEVDDSGSVSKLGLDLRQEELDTPLVWFNRVERGSSFRFAGMSGSGLFRMPAWIV